jgi:hypothetical protein
MWESALQVVDHSPWGAMQLEFDFEFDICVCVFM